jgi:hypothetical protein
MDPDRPAGEESEPGSARGGPGAKRHVGLIIGITVVAVTVVAAAAAGALLLLRKSESPTMMALKSGQAMASAAGLSFSGTTAGGAASLTVTRQDTVEGSYAQEGDRVGVVMIDGVAYLKAPATFWVDEDIDPGTARLAAGHWAKAPPEDVNLDFAALTPVQVSRALEHVGRNPKATTLDNGKLIKLSERGTSYYITTASPNRLVRITSGSGLTAYSLDVTALSATTIGPIFTILHADVQELQGAADPVAVVNPDPKVHFGANCAGVSSCRVSVKVTVTDSGTPLTLVKMTIDFSAAKNGKPFATCADTVAAATGGAFPGPTLMPSCGLAGAVWSNWVNSHSSGFFTWATPYFQTKVNTPSDIAALQRNLDQQQR